ncbi:MAG: hypothetical protein ACT452_19105 [Microthrixaceae bacterium]
MPEVRLTIEYSEEADKYFWLREPPDGSRIDGLRERVAAIYSGLPPRAFLMLDAAVAGDPVGAQAVLDAIPHLSEKVAGEPVRIALDGLVRALLEAPAPPSERRELVERALKAINIDVIEQSIGWVADLLDFRFPPSSTVEVDVKAVAAGVPLGGLTGARIDDRPICFVSVVGQEGSTFAEAVIHEATHVLDMSCKSDESLVERLRQEPGASHQLWHAPFFVAAAEATRRFVDPGHKDFGDTHGYYVRVPGEMAALEQRGLLAKLRR